MCGFNLIINWMAVVPASVPMLLTKIEKGTFSSVSLESLSLTLSTCSTPPILWQLSSLSFSILSGSPPPLHFSLMGQVFLPLSNMLCTVICSIKLWSCHRPFAQVVSERLTIPPLVSVTCRHFTAYRLCCFMSICIYIQGGISDAAGGAFSTMSCAHEQQCSARCSFLKFAVQKICRVHIEQVVR